MERIQRPYKKIHIIGNSPFGHQSLVAIQFIKNVVNLLIQFYLFYPKSFKKDSNKAKFIKFFHLIYEKDLPENSFSVNCVNYVNCIGCINCVNYDNYDVPCVFQIWKKKKTERIIPDKIKPKNFKFVNKT